MLQNCVLHGWQVEEMTVNNGTKKDTQGTDEFFRSIFENAQIGIGIYNIQTGEHFSNRAVKQMLGYGPEKLCTVEQWDNIVHPDERVSGAKRYAELMQGVRDEDEWEQRFIRRDGRVVIANGRFKLIRDASGKPHYIVTLNEDVTERRQAEAERIRVSKQMQLLLDSTGQGVYGLDLEGKCTFVNRATCEMIGYRTEDVLGRNMHELVHHHRVDGSPYPPNECPVAQAVASGKGCHVDEEVLWRKDGTALPVEYSSFPIMEDGAIQGAVVTVSDITERKRVQGERTHSEESLRASEQLFRSIFEGAQIGIGVFKIDTGEHFSNRALHEMLGYSAEELSRIEQWDAIVPTEERDSYARRYEDLIRGRLDKDEYTQHFIRRDGHVLLGNSRFQLLRNLAGQPQCIVALTEDITEHTRAKEELQASEQLFRSVFENAQIGIGIYNIQTGEHFSNRATHEMLGYSQEELRRTGQWDLIVHPDERAQGAKRYGDLIQGSRDQDKWEQRFIRRDGQLVIANGRFKLIRDAAGKPAYVVALNEDITQRKHTEEELVAAKEAAVSATQAKSEFLANMSHEIRTPMNAILGMTHLALKTALTSKQRDYLTKVKAAAESLLSVINDILDFSKIEAGKLDMEQVDFRLHDVLDNLSTIVSQKAHDKGLEFLIAPAQGLPTILVGDPLRLGQVLINLVNNAVKFTQQGEVIVSVKFEERVAGKVKLKFAVRDSGVGMTPEQTARLFQAFSQADASTTRKYGGTGLGLSISKRLVEMMEGSVWAESAYGQGSTFYFTAWFGLGAEAKNRKDILHGFGGLRALVVDDNSVAREILTSMLDELSIRVTSVSNGSDALRELALADQQDPYNLVLMDWQMRGMDGLETSREIKNAAKLQHPPKIILITAFGREDVRLQAEEMAIEGFLQKPVSPSTLLDTLMNLFGGSSREETLTVRDGSGDIGPIMAGVRVLLVEDNEVNQQVATELLESEGARVTIASHGAEAVEVLSQVHPAHFDLVLMDLQMPEMDGFTATRLLRARPELQRIPIIAMTAHVMAEEVQRCLEAGMNDHVGKPINPAAFFATLSRWFDPKRQRAGNVRVTLATRQKQKTALAIAGVDVDEGLQRLAGNEELYWNLLTQFTVKQTRFGQRITAEIQGGNPSEAERLAHSLKGAAGNLGIREIFDLAGKVERGIHDRQLNVEDLVNTLSSALTRQIQIIEAALAATSHYTKPRELAPAEPAAVLRAVARLKALLEANDADAADAYKCLAELLRDTVEPSRLEALGTAISGFTFEDALKQLDLLAKGYKPEEQR